jgi:hypothetical protein
MQETETDMITAGNGSGHIAEVKVKDVEDSQNASDSQATDNVIPMKSQGFVAQLKQVASSVEELFVQIEREYVFDSGYDQGIKEGVEKGKGEREDEIIMNMLENSADDEFILKVTNCSREHLQELKKIIF